MKGLDQMAPRGRKASSTRNLKPQTSNLAPHEVHPYHSSERRYLPSSR